MSMEVPGKISLMTIHEAKPIVGGKMASAASQMTTKEFVFPGPFGMVRILF